MGTGYLLVYLAFWNVLGVCLQTKNQHEKIVNLYMNWIKVPTSMKENMRIEYCTFSQIKLLIFVPDAEIVVCHEEGHPLSNMNIFIVFIIPFLNLDFRNLLKFTGEESSFVYSSLIHCF